MSPCSGSVLLLLLVLLEVLITSGSPIQVLPENVKQTHESIADVLELKKPKIGSEPLFNSVMKRINTSCQRKEEIQLMNATLDIYMRIFSSILHQNGGGVGGVGGGELLLQLPAAERPQVEAALTELQQKMEKVKKRLNHHSHEREDVLTELSQIKVDDPLVQRKALAQFKEIYQAASVIGSRRCGPAPSSHAK